MPDSTNQLILNEIDVPANPISVNEEIPISNGISNDFQQEPMYSIAPMPNSLDAWPQLDFDLSFPSFFESIMVPESNWVGAGEVQMPPDLATVIPDYEEWPGSGDIFGFDFSAAFEQAMDAPPQAMHEPVDSHTTITVSGGEGGNTSTDTARERHDIFKRSPWLVRDLLAIRELN